jgi:hypothetical protein
MLVRRRRSGGGTDRLTLGLASAAIGTTAAVFGGQVARLARRHTTATDDDAGVIEVAEHALEAATLATHDTVTVAIEGYTAAPKGETILFNMLSGFLGGFALMRLGTWGIRSGWWPSGDVLVRGRHVHHFVPGILTAFAAGGAGLITRSERIEQALAIPFGAGIGLTFDEAALLLELDDVYWSREGVLSIQLSLGTTGLLAATILALRMLRRGERESAQAGLIPDERGEYTVATPAPA